MNSVDILLEDQKDRLHNMLHKEFDAPEISIECIHESDGFIYNDEEHKDDAPIYRCKKCGEYYEGINEG